MEVRTPRSTSRDANSHGDPSGQLGVERQMLQPGFHREEIVLAGELHAVPGIIHQCYFGAPHGARKAIEHVVHAVAVEVGRNDGQEAKFAQ